MYVVIENMYKNGMTVPMIADKTGYAIEDVTSILQELQIM